MSPPSSANPPISSTCCPASCFFSSFWWIFQLIQRRKMVSLSISGSGFCSVPGLGPTFCRWSRLAPVEACRRGRWSRVRCQAEDGDKNSNGWVVVCGFAACYCLIGFLIVIVWIWHDFGLLWLLLFELCFYLIQRMMLLNLLLKVPPSCLVEAV